MCTLTILRESGRVLVTMNRDDAASREEAPPQRWPDAELAFGAPRDVQAGGTWIGANRHGIIACLLNRYDDAPKGKQSRGGIVIEAMRGASIEASVGAVTSLELTTYSPFTCIVIVKGGAVRLDWDGTRLRRGDFANDEELAMATSSSWRFDEVKAQREALFQDLMSDRGDIANKLATFHSRRVPADDAWAPMMLRPQSLTKSVTQIELIPSGAEVRYWTREAAIARELKAPEHSIHIPN
ncbi:MAG: NRDE family protein [Hyphomonadaceae bacterium]